MSCRCNSIVETSLALSVQEYFLSADPLWRNSALTVAAAAGHGEGLKLALTWNHGLGFCLRRPMGKLCGKLNITLRSQTEAEASINRTLLHLKTEGEERFTFTTQTEPARAVRYTFAFWDDFHSMLGWLMTLECLSVHRLLPAGQSWVSYRSPGTNSSRDSQHTSGSSHFQTKTWWLHPRHNPPRPLQAQPGLFQSPRDGFGEYILVKGTRMRGMWILPKDQMYVALWAWQEQQQHVPFCPKTSHDHFRKWCPHPTCLGPLTT